MADQDTGHAWPELDELRQGWLGEIHLPGSTGYTANVSTWHVNPLLKEPYKPRVLLLPRGTKDCQRAVKWARAQGLGVSVKAGGHSPNNACIAGEVCIMLGLMRGVFVDPEEKTVLIEGGCQLGDIDAEAGLHKLGFPLGHAPVTGMGLIINGGIGIASKRFGPAAEHILALTIVLADGSAVECNPKSHPDLFWAVRGVGSAFGVVTKLKCRLHDVSDCLGGMITLPYDKDVMKAAARWLVDVGWRKKDFCGTLFVVQPPGAPRVLVLDPMYFGDETREEKIAFLEPIRKLPVIEDKFGSLDYAGVQDAFRPMFFHLPNRYEYATTGGWPMGEMTPEILDRVCTEIYSAIPEPLSPSVFTFDYWYGGKLQDRNGPLGFSNSEVGMLCLVEWMDPAHTEMGIAFAKHCKATLKSLSQDEGIYANADFIEPEMVNDAGIARRVGGFDNLSRLREIKAKYDCDNMFRRHHFTGLVLDKGKADVALS